MRDTRPLITATIYVSRDGIEDIPVALEGRYSAGRPGRKAHPMDRFAEPDEPDEMEITEAKWGQDVPCMEVDGEPIGLRWLCGSDADLTDAELDKAEEALWEALEGRADDDRELRAERRLERGREEA